MMNLLRAGANTLAQAAQEVAEELRSQSDGQGGRTAKDSSRTSLGDTIWLGPSNRIGLCGFPDRSLAGEVLREDRSLKPFQSPSSLKKEIVAAFPEGDYLIWNLAGLPYNYDELDGKIIEYNFPTRPMPPFAVVLEIVQAIKSWVAESPSHVAIVHDVSGRRAAVVVACVLESLEYYPRTKALEFVTKEMDKAGEALVASQMRYFDYFCKFHWRESESPAIDLKKTLRIQRIIVNGIPDYTNETRLAGKDQRATCRPFVKVMDVKDEEIESSRPPDRAVPREEMSFNIVPGKPLLVSEDVLIRFFHARPDGREASMFGIALHMAFVNDIVLRFDLDGLDGTLKNPRFPSDMFVDIVVSEPDSDVLNYSSVIESAPSSLKKRETAESSAKPATSAQVEGEVSRSSPILQPAETPVTGQSTPVIVSPKSTDNENSVLREIEAALGEEDFAVEDFEVSELDDLKDE
jgi:hypothetical protein